MNRLMHEMANEKETRCARFGESLGELSPAFGVSLVRMCLSASPVTRRER
jgi:hypothetical protein